MSTLTAGTALEEHLADLARAMAAVDKATGQLIVDELAEAMPALEEAEQKAAGELREACAALEGPERAVAGLDGEIAHAETELASWRSQIADCDVGGRVTARAWISEWEAEREALTAKREFVQSGMLPLVDARNKCRADLELVTGAKRGLAYAMLLPYESVVAQGTAAYIQFRQPRLTYVLLMGDPAHPEWDAAVAELRELCMAVMRAGHDIAADLPGFGELAFRAMTTAMTDAAPAWADPAPSGADVVAADVVAVQNAALSATKTVIEDHRNRPPVPRVVAQRDYMRAPRVRDMLGR